MQTPEQVAAAFDLLADQHDAMRWDLALSEFDASVLASLEGIATANVASSALFLAGGSGREALSFVMHGWKCDLVELSRRMLELAECRLHKFDLRIVESEAARYLADTTEKYDFISMVGELVGYVQEPRSILRAAALRLRPDGLIAVTWVDSSSLAATRQTEEQGVVALVERDDLEIRAWTCETMQKYVDAARLTVVLRSGRMAESPRRFWILRKEM